MNLADLPDTWRALAESLRRFGADPQARTLEACADELTAKLQQRASELLTLHQAAAQSGYTADHIGLLVREGKIPNAGRKSKPLVRRSDLPLKPGSTPGKVEKRRATGYVPDRLFRDIITSKFGADDAQR